MAFRASVELDTVGSRSGLLCSVLGLELSPGSRCLRFVSEVGSLVMPIQSQMRIAKLSVPKSSKGSVWMSKSGGNLLSDGEMTAFSKSTQDLGSGKMADTIVNHLKALCQVQFLIHQSVEQSTHPTKGLSVFHAGIHISLCPHPPLNQAIFPSIAGCPALNPPSTAHAWPLT